MVHETERAVRAADLVAHGLDALLAAGATYEMEAQTSLKRGTLNLRHAREVFGRAAARRSPRCSRPTSPVMRARSPGARRRVGPDLHGGHRRPDLEGPLNPACSGILAPTPQGLVVRRTEGPCAAHSAAPGTHGSWTRGTSTSRRRSGAAASAPRARRGSPPTSGRGRAAGRGQARRHPPGVRPGQAGAGPGEGADQAAGAGRRRRAGSRRDRGRASLVGAVRDPELARRRRWRWTSSGRWTTSPTSGSRPCTRASRTWRTSSARWTRCSPRETPKKGKGKRGA